MVLRALKYFCETGKCGLFGNGGLIMFDISSVKISYRSTDLLPVIILGIIGGLIGSLFNYLLDKILRVYNLINGYVVDPSKVLIGMNMLCCTLMY